MFRDMLLARSPTDFLWVHSSSISPTPSRYMTEPAVSKSDRRMETVMCSRPASRMAESTARGMASFRAQEKSTMSTDKARVRFRVSTRLTRLPAKV